MIKNTGATTEKNQSIYPFVALIGQEKMKLALCLLAIHPGIGGLLLRGQKGTAKSTAVRSMAALSLFGEPINLPLGATEEMVVGAIDFEAAVKHGEPRFLPGLLHRAHGGVLYVDEVNLLDDHLVDCILDAAESGMNRVEREGLQFCHPSNFALVGSMNPEEGELRPQLLDRFGLAVEITGETDLNARVSLMQRRERFDKDPARFIRTYQEETVALCERIDLAKSRISGIAVPSRLLAFAAELGKENNVAGHRADLAIVRAACAHAAWMGRDGVEEEDIQAVAAMALLHRSRDAAPPTSPPHSNAESDAGEPTKSADTQTRHENRSDTTEPMEADGESTQSNERNNENQDQRTPETSNTNEDNDSDEETVFNVGVPFRVRPLPSKTDQKRRCGSGRRSRSCSANKHGRYVRSTMERRSRDIALDATLRAAAPFQTMRKQAASRPLAIHIHEDDIREKIRERRLGNVLIFAVDGSGSMGAMQRMVETKGAIMSLLLDAYQKRDKVSLVVFRGQKAEVILPPTGSVALASRLLTDLPIGGRTPLSAGLCQLSEVLSQTVRKDPLSQPIAVIITDGKANAALSDGPAHREALDIARQMGKRFEQTRFIVVNTENKSAVRLGLAQSLADALFADCFEPDALSAGDLVSLVKERV